MAERRRRLGTRQRRIRWALLALAVLAYVPAVHQLRSRYTMNVIIGQVGGGMRTTMDIFASRIPPGLQALRIEAGLAAALVADPARRDGAAAHVREVAGRNGLAGDEFAVAVLDDAGHTVWSSSSAEPGGSDRVVARQPSADGALLLRKVGARYLLDVAVRADSSGRGGLVAVRVPPRILLPGPLHPSSPVDSTGSTSLLALDGDEVALVATEGADSATSRGPWPRAQVPASIASALRGRPSGGEGEDLWGRQSIVAARPIPVPGMVIVRTRGTAEVRALARASFWLDSIIVSAGSALLVLMMIGIYRFARMRRAQDIAELRSDFVAGVSHELRTPLSQIRLFAQLLREGTVSTEEEVERSLRVIDNEARRLTFLVDNVLDFARAEHAVHRPSPVPTDVARSVDEAVEAFAPIAETREARLEARVDDGLRVLADPRALHQIILNFLDNALKYGPTGQTVRVSASAADGRVRLCVDDQGPGVPAAERERIWRQFYRLERGAGDGAGRDAGGTGIGLSVVSELVEAYGGRVAVEDAPGGGARFVAELPGAGATERPDAERADAERPA